MELNAYLLYLGGDETHSKNNSVFEQTETIRLLSCFRGVFPQALRILTLLHSRTVFRQGPLDCWRKFKVVCYLCLTVLELEPRT